MLWPREPSSAYYGLSPLVLDYIAPHLAELENVMDYVWDGRILRPLNYFQKSLSLVGSRSSVHLLLLNISCLRS